MGSSTWDFVVHNRGNSELELLSILLNLRGALAAVYSVFNIFVPIKNSFISDCQIVFAASRAGDSDWWSDRRRCDSQVLDYHVSWISSLFIKAHYLEVLRCDVVKYPLGFFRPQNLFGVVAWSWQKWILDFVINTQWTFLVLMIYSAAVSAFAEVWGSFGQCVESCFRVTHLLDFL